MNSEIPITQIKYNIISSTYNYFFLQNFLIVKYHQFGKNVSGNINFRFDLKIK
jgi:hypothetical protein